MVGSPWQSVGALSAPALRGDGDQRAERRVLGQRREVVVGGVGLAVAPLDEKPDRRTLVELVPLLGARSHTAHREASGELSTRGGAPREALELPFRVQLGGELAQVDGLAAAIDDFAHLEDLRGRGHTNRVRETQAVDPEPEIARGAVARIGEDDAEGSPSSCARVGISRASSGFVLKTTSSGMRASRRRASSSVQLVGR